MAGRIEAYIHSDSYTENKGGCIFKVTCKSDAAANTDVFKKFCKDIARYVYAADENVDPFFLFEDANQLKKDVEKELKEAVAIEEKKTLKILHSLRVSTGASYARFPGVM